MMDNFFRRTTCERCHKSLEGGRIMSMFNTQVICMECREAERKEPGYKEAVEAELREVRRGNYNFKGIRGLR